MRRFFAHVGIGVASFIVTFALYLFLDIIYDELTRPPAKLRTAFSELVQEVGMGGVEEIRVDGHRYTYRARGSAKEHETLGPEMTKAEVATLRPSDTTLPAPKVIYIKHP